MLCERCVKLELDDRLRTAADPEKHETCLVCDPGSSLSVMITQDAVTALPFQSSEHMRLQQLTAPLPGGAAEVSKEKLDAAVSAAALTGVRLGLAYTITVELWLPSLPPTGQKQALLRFSPPPPAVGRAARRQHASVYVNSDGAVGGPSLLLESRRRTNAHKRALLTSAGMKCALYLSATSSMQDVKAVPVGSKVMADKEEEAAEGKEKEGGKEVDEAVTKDEEVKTAQAEGASSEQSTSGGINTDATAAGEAAEPKEGEADGDKVSEEQAAKEAKEAKDAAVAEFRTAQAKEIEAKRADDAEIKHPGSVAAGASSSTSTWTTQLPLTSSCGKLAAMAEAWRRLVGPKGLGYLSKQGRVGAQRWCSITVAVDAGASPQPISKIYVDGQICPGASLLPLQVRPTAAAGGTGENDPQQILEEYLTLLGLGRRVVLFGGGKQAEARGGRLRRLRIVDGLPTSAQVAREHRVEIMGQNPLHRGAATLIQGAVRRMAARQIVHAARLARGAPRKRDTVEANYKGAGVWYPGKVTFVEGNTTSKSIGTVEAWSCTVRFDDGDVEEHVARNAVRIKEGGGQ